MSGLLKTIQVTLPWNEIDKLVVSELVELKKAVERNLEDRYNDVGLALFEVDKAHDISEHKELIKSLDLVLKAMYRASHYNLTHYQKVEADEE